MAEVELEEKNNTYNSGKVINVLVTVSGSSGRLSNCSIVSLCHGRRTTSNLFMGPWWPTTKEARDQFLHAFLKNVRTKKTDSTCTLTRFFIDSSFRGRFRVGIEGNRKALEC